MKCTSCGSDTLVTDSRPGIEGEVRRRRECISCKARFTTRERADSTNMGFGHGPAAVTLTNIQTLLDLSQVGGGS